MISPLLSSNQNRVQNNPVKPSYNLLSGDNTSFANENRPQAPRIQPQAQRNPASQVGNMYLRFNQGFKVLQARAVASRAAV